MQGPVKKKKIVSHSAKLMARQKRLMKKADALSKARGLASGFTGGFISDFEAASDVLPGERFKGRRHSVPKFTHRDTTWAFRAGAVAGMAVPGTKAVKVGRAVKGAKTLKPGVYKGGKLVKQTAAEKARGLKYMNELQKMKSKSVAEAGMDHVKRFGRNLPPKGYTGRQWILKHGTRAEKESMFRWERAVRRKEAAQAAGQAQRKMTWNELRRRRSEVIQTLQDINVGKIKGGNTNTYAMNLREELKNLKKLQKAMR